MTGNADARIAQMVAAHSASPLGVSAAIELAAQANETEHEALALPVLTSVAAKNSGDFRLWQLIGLLQR